MNSKTPVSGPPPGGTPLREAWRFAAPEVLVELQEARAEYSDAAESIGCPPAPFLGDKMRDLWREKTWADVDRSMAENRNRYGGDPDVVRSREAAERLEEAQKAIVPSVHSQLISGKLRAWGRATHAWNEWQEIPQIAWEHLVATDQALTAVEHRTNKTTRFNEVLVWRAEEYGNIRSADSPVAVEDACEQWLRTLVSKGKPSKRKYGRNLTTPNTADSSYLGEAQQKFPGLSRRGFDRAWGNAMRNEPEWTKPGRKSQR